jgi:hypothetical protein
MLQQMLTNQLLLVRMLVNLRQLHLIQISLVIKVKTYLNTQISLKIVKLVKEATNASIQISWVLQLGTCICATNSIFFVVSAGDGATGK